MRPWCGRASTPGSAPGCTASVRQQLGVKRTCQRLGWIDAIDPNVWSGRALQEGFVELAVGGLASMYPASGRGSLLRAIMEISAPAISLADRPQRAIRVTSVRKRRENRSSISSHPLADLGGQSGYVRVSSVLRRTIKQAGWLSQQPCPPRSCGHKRERPMRCAPACWQARSPGRCGAAASWPPRSRV